MEGRRVLTVGILMKPSKVQKLLKRLCSGQEPVAAASSGDEAEEKQPQMAFRYTALSIEKPLENQGSFDIILLKPNDWVVRSLFHADDRATAIVEGWESYLERNPSICAIEPPSALRAAKSVKIGVSDWRQRRSEFATNLAALQYPVICKRYVACGTTESHQMIIAKDLNGLLQSLDESVASATPTTIGEDPVVTEKEAAGDMKHSSRNDNNHNSSNICGQADFCSTDDVVAWQVYLLGRPRDRGGGGGGYKCHIIRKASLPKGFFRSSITTNPTKTKAAAAAATAASGDSCGSSPPSRSGQRGPGGTSSFDEKKLSPIPPKTLRVLEEICLSVADKFRLWTIGVDIIERQPR
eukprot:jgi/Bigna1/78257/fgenesh1_pg.53_\